MGDVIARKKEEVLVVLDGGVEYSRYVVLII